MPKSAVDWQKTAPDRWQWSRPADTTSKTTATCQLYRRTAHGMVPLPRRQPTSGHLWIGALSRNLNKALASPAPLSSATRLPFLDDTERVRLSAAKGCWRCRKIPTDAGWVPHVGRTCPGDAANGVQPGRDFIPGIKTEIAAGIFLAADTSEDQPEYDADEYSNAFYAVDDSDSE